MSTREQEAAVVWRAVTHLQVLHQLHPYLDQEVLITVAHALVTSRLDYGNTFYEELPLKTIWKFQLVQLCK